MLRTKLLILGLLTFGVGGAGVAAASSITSTPQPAIMVSQPVDVATSLVTAADEPTGTLPITFTAPISSGNKVAVALSRYFSVPLTQVVQLHNSGWGFGEIFKLYQYAELAGKTPEQIQAMRDAGMGWGVIARTLSIRPGNAGYNLGGIMSGRNLTKTVTLKQSTITKKIKPRAPVQVNKNKPGPKNSHGNGGGNGGNPGKKP